MSDLPTASEVDHLQRVCYHSFYVEPITSVSVFCAEVLSLLGFFPTERLKNSIFLEDTCMLCFVSTESKSFYKFYFLTALIFPLHVVHDD